MFWALFYKRGDENHEMQCPFGHCIIKNVYSNPQCNPISLCIKELITASMPTSQLQIKSLDQMEMFCYVKEEKKMQCLAS